MDRINEVDQADHGSPVTQPTGKIPRSDRRPEPNGRLQRDVVEISARGQLHLQLLSRLASIPEIRRDRVNEIRERIARGDFVTDEKIDRAVEAIVRELDELGGISS